jgi:hypothetical protein
VQPTDPTDPTDPAIPDGTGDPDVGGDGFGRGGGLPATGGDWTVLVLAAFAMIAAGSALTRPRRHPAA